MTGLVDLIAGLLGGRKDTLPLLLPGDMPADPSYRRMSGYDPDAARWAQISRALLEAGAHVASAPRGQAIGQGLRGFIEGIDAGKAKYEDDFLKAYRRRQLAPEGRTDSRPAVHDTPALQQDPMPPVPIPLAGASSAGMFTKQHMTKPGESQTGDSLAVGGAPPSSGAVLMEEAIDGMPLAELLSIDPAQLRAAQLHAVSRRLFREGY